jgi:hypothetical protein
MLAGQTLADECDIFGEPQVYATASHHGTVAGDFDGDDVVDLLTVKPPRRDSFGNLISHGQYIFNRNNGEATSFKHLLIDDDHGGYGVAAGDLNGDGALDFVSTNTIDIAGNLVNVVMGQGDGTFATVVSYGSFSSEAAVAIALGDMDGDGDLDMVLPNGGRVWLNDGNGVFYTEFVGSDVRDGASIALGDIDEDGHLDIVTTVDSYVPSRHEVAVQLGIGNGFGNPGPVFMVNIGGGSPAVVALSDMNGDEHLDLLTLNQATGNISLLLGAGDGSFGAPMMFAAHTAGNFVPNVFVVADLTGDGAMDVTVTSTVYGNAESHQETGILIGDGAGGLTLLQTIVRFGQLDENIVAADLNGNGHIDLATATHVLLNLTGTTQVADLNGDGIVNISDLLIVIGYWGTADSPADINDDGIVDVSDLLILIAAWGPCE